MDLALLEARAAIAHGDVPVGAIVVNIETGEITASRHNERELTQDTTAHAEVLALRDASLAIGSWRLNEYALVVTLEPCPMCAGASINSRIGLVIFGAADQRLEPWALSTTLPAIRALTTKFKLLGVSTPTRALCC